MEPITVVIYLAAAVIGLIVWYYLIKNAVRNGYVAAQRDIEYIEKERASAAAAKAEAAKSLPPKS